MQVTLCPSGFCFPDKCFEKVEGAGALGKEASEWEDR